MVDYRGCLIPHLSTEPHIPVMAVSSVVSASTMAVGITDNENFATILDHHIKVDMTSPVQTARVTTLQCKFAIDSDMLAQRWGIPLHKVKMTDHHTTQCGLMNIVNPPLARCFCTNECML